MRVMTYNLLTGGQDGLSYTRWPKIVEVIRSQAPDVLVLNECNGFEWQGHTRLHQMERELSMRGVLGHAASGFHLAVFTRHEAWLESRTLQTGMHHGALKAVLLWRDQPLTVVAAHLCPFSGQTRLQEAQYLASFARADERVLVAGDLNAISPHDTGLVDVSVWDQRRLVRHTLPAEETVLPMLDTRAIATLERAGLVDLARQAGDDAPTALTPLAPQFEAHQLRIDYVFGTEPMAQRLSSAWVVSDATAQQASDHYPLCVDFD